MDKLDICALIAAFGFVGLCAAQALSRLNEKGLLVLISLCLMTMTSLSFNQTIVINEMVNEMYNAKENFNEIKDGLSAFITGLIQDFRKF